MTDQELIGQLRGGDMDVLLDAADRLAALQVENAEKDKEVVRLKLEKELMRQEWDTSQAALSRMEAERDAAKSALAEYHCRVCPIACKGVACKWWRGAQGEA